MSNKYLKKRKVKTRNFSFRSNTNKSNKSIIFQVLIVFLLLITAYILILFISNTDLILKINNYFIIFIDQFRSTIYSLYYTLYYLLIILFIVLLILFTFIVFISSILRTYKLTNYLFNRKKRF